MSGAIINQLDELKIFLENTCLNIQSLALIQMERGFAAQKG